MIDLVIIERQGDEWSPRIIFGGKNDVKRYVYVYKNGEHYDGLDFVESMTPWSINPNFPCDKFMQRVTEFPGARQDDPQLTLAEEKQNTSDRSVSTRVKSPRHNSVATKAFNMQQDNPFKICFWNIRRLTPHKLDMQICGSFLSEHDIILLCETWSLNNHTIELSGFVYVDAYRKYRHKNARRSSGGIGIFIRENIYSHGVDIYRTNSDVIIWVRLNKDPFGFQKDIMLGMVYFAPENSTYNTDDYFTVLYKKLASLPDNVDILVCGDFNSRTSDYTDYIEPEAQTGSEGGLSQFLPNDAH